SCTHKYATQKGSYAKNNNQQIKVSFLGGVGEIGKNMNVIECGDDMIIVDFGVAFLNNDSFGIDGVIPDITYVRQNIKKLRGIFLTHGHEDHIGAIPYYIDELKNVPIYGTALTLGILKRKLEHNAYKCNLKTVAEGDTVSAGCFKVEFIKVCHSMSGACALSISTPAGRVFVTGDFKMDNTPIDKKKTNTSRIAKIGAEGVLLMLGESTNVERPGSSTSEKVVGQNLEKIFKNNPQKRLVLACFASSNYRVQQILWLAKKFGRKVVLVGKSMKSIVDVASGCGALEIPKGTIVESVGKLLPSETVVLATGSQGEPLSALKKLSKGEFNKIDIGEDDVVVLSSSPIPGNEKAVYDVINDLFKKGAKVVYDAMNDIHVSGHAYQDELGLMLTLVHPKYFFPVHGEYRHQFRHAELAKSLGISKRNIIIADIGDSYGVSEKGIRRHASVPSGNVYVDEVMLEDGERVLEDRRSLAEYGILIVICAVDMDAGKIASDVDIVARGVGLSDDDRNAIINSVYDSIISTDFDRADVNDVAKNVKRGVRKLFARERSSFPIIIPIVVEA
ncbi:MAG: ribonuclease J, partial [Clostridia bacterium]|nr:ribonuclease J [Clostridia bacterium]